MLPNIMELLEYKPDDIILLLQENLLLDVRNDSFLARFTIDGIVRERTI